MIRKKLILSLLSVLILFILLKVLPYGPINIQLRSKESLRKNNTTVPNSIHFIWFSNRDNIFQFQNLLSLLAAQNLAKPKKIFFHYDEEPSGQYWNETKLKMTNMILVRRKAPLRVFGEVGPEINYIEHQSDIARIQILKQEGGIYLDLDVLALKPFTELLHYDFTMGLEYKGNPGRLNNGIILSKPNAQFLHIWHKTYDTFQWREWDEHSCQETYRLSETYPHLIHVEEKSLNYPSGPMKHLIYNSTDFNWTNNYAIHLWSRLHKIKYTPDSIRSLNTTFGKIARLIYYGNTTYL